MASAVAASSRVVRSPARVATSVQSVLSSATDLLASAAQFTGLKRATAWIQPGASFCCMKTDERNVSGRITLVTAAIRVSRCRVTSARAFESAANVMPTTHAIRISRTTPATPFANRAPSARAMPMITSDCTTIVTAP